MSPPIPGLKISRTDTGSVVGLQTPPLATEQPYVAFDNDISMEDVSNVAANLPQTTNEVSTPVVASSNASTGTKPSTFSNPWSKFASFSSFKGFGGSKTSTEVPDSNLKRWAGIEMDRVGQVDERTDHPFRAISLNHCKSQQQGPSALKAESIDEDLAAVGGTFSKPRPRISISTLETSGLGEECDSTMKEEPAHVPANGHTKAGQAPATLANDVKHGGVKISKKQRKRLAKTEEGRRVLEEKGKMYKKTKAEKRAEQLQDQEYQKSQNKMPVKHQTKKQKQQNGKKNEEQDSNLEIGRSDPTTTPNSRVPAFTPGIPNGSAYMVERLDPCTKAFAIEGIESLRKRYKHLNPDLPPGQEWMFAWQEIIAVLRTPAHYKCFPVQGGFSVNLYTNFKIFRFQGPFADNPTSKDFITKKAVLHVIDGPFFFEDAEPALKGPLLSFSLFLIASTL